MGTYKNPISLEFVQGDDLILNIELDQTTGGAPVDLTGAVIKSSIRKEYGQPVLASFTTTNTDLINGKFKLALDNVTTAGLPTRSGSRITSFVWDVDITYSGGIKDTPLYGYLKMIRQVTV